MPRMREIFFLLYWISIVFILNIIQNYLTCEVFIEYNLLIFDILILNNFINPMSVLFHLQISILKMSFLYF